ncbi:MAG: hypothetical protein K2K45_09910 [Muribaculaceae bacterium]|nr:hypothetical protein [Muribaculaceae bacterium]
MNKILLSCIALAAGTAIAMGQKATDYPEKLDLTLNGETAIPGVEVLQEMETVKQDYEPYESEDYLTVSITGKCEADEITVTVAVPQGWDEVLTYSGYGATDEDENTRAFSEDDDYWMPLFFADMMGWKHSNVLKFKVDGAKQEAKVALVKGDNMYTLEIDFDFMVAKGESSVESIDSIDGKAVYYTIDGVKVDEPTTGIYVRVHDGKAYKMIVK